VPARVLDPDSHGGRRLDRAKAGRIDVQPAEARSTVEDRSARALPPPIAARDARGYERRGVEQPRKLPRSLPAPARGRMRDCHSTRSRLCAVKHGAVGGRMTARWSGVFRGRSARALDSGGGSRSGTPAVSSTALGGQSPKRVFLRRVLVSETSVVETDSKHRGGAPEESREASRGAHRRATGRRETRTGPIVIHFAQRCDGSQAPKGRSGPSVDASSESLDSRSSLDGRSPGCGLNPWKARGISIPESAKHARWNARSRLRDRERQCGDWPTAPWSDITRPRRRLFVGLPQPMGAGSLWTALSPPRR
jgi:hypothetical protein